MAQIPDFQALGPTPTPTPSYRRPFTDQSGEILARAGEGFGETLQRVGDDQYAQQQQLLNAKAEVGVLDHRLSVANAAETMRQQVASGDVPYEQARAKFDQQVQNIPQPSFEGLKPQIAASLQGETRRTIAQAQFGIDNVVTAARKDDFKDQFGAGLDKLGKLAGMPGANIDQINTQAEVFRPLGRQAGIPESVIDKSLQNFKDQNWLNQATQRSMESKDNMHQLKGLEHDLTAQDGFYAGKLDTDKRNVVLRGVINDRLILQNRIEHEQDKREMKAQGALRQMDEQNMSGIPATPAMMENWQNLTKGTTAESDFGDRVKEEGQIQDVLRKPVDQQISYVQERRAALESQGGSIRDAANLNRLQTAVNQNVNLMQKAPLLFSANRNGTETPPLDLQHLQSPDGQKQVGAQIQDRMATLDALRKQYGSAISTTPLLPQEASELTKQLDTSTPAAKAQMLTTLRNSFNNDDAYQAAMRQIAPNSPVTAIAGQMVGHSSPASTPVWFDRNYAPDMTTPQRILQGEALLNPDKAGKADAEGGKVRASLPMPKDDGTAGLRAQFGEAAGDLFRDRPELGEAHYAVFKDAYASLLAEKGDFKGQGDDALAKQALKMSLGNTADFNGQKVSVPIGMDPTRFSGLIDNAVTAMAHKLGAPPNWAERMPGYQLREMGGLGSGRYEVLNGNLPVTAKGRPFIIDLKQQYTGGNAQGSPDDQARRNP